MNKIRVLFITKCSALGKGVLNTFRGNGKIDFTLIPFKNFSSLPGNYSGKNTVMIFSDIGITRDECVLIHNFISDENISAKKILYTASNNRDYLITFILDGAKGIVSSSDEPGLIKEAVLNVSMGNNFIGALIRKICLPEAENKKTAETPALTRREKEIVEQLKQGKTGRQIAGDLFVDIKTVDSHISRILRKFKVKKLRELILILTFEAVQILLIIIPLLSQEIT